MPTIQEALSDNEGILPIHDALAQGMDVLSGDQTVEFIPYIRQILPIDGFVFWIKASLLPPQLIAEHKLASADPVSIPGSLHYASVGMQSEHETIAIRRVDFAAQEEIPAFAEIAPNVLYIGIWNTRFGSFKFSFSDRLTYYTQANINHYVGDAVYPVFDTQLIDSLSEFSQRQVVSNSLPLWLSLHKAPAYPSLITFNVELFPANLVPDNKRPPYGTVFVDQRSTQSFQAAPFLSRTATNTMLCSERVTLTFFGLRNEDIHDLLMYIYEYSANTDYFGIMNIPTIRDEHKTQAELAAVAMLKTVEFEISYYQYRAREIARQLIKLAVIGSVYINDAPPIVFPPDPIVPPLYGHDIYDE